MAKRKAGANIDTSGEVWVRITSVKRKYFISRMDVGAVSRIDDEAQLEIAGTIEAISPSQKKHFSAPMQISLLSAQDYGAEAPITSAFFGSLTLRGSQRSALAYLPAKPFWELPMLISGGATLLCLGWRAINRGSADLTSVFVGDESDLQEFGATCVQSVSDVARTLQRAC